MNANDFGGHTSALPRLFSIPTLAAGVIMLAQGMGEPILPGIYGSEQESLIVAAIAIPLGLHGMFTNTAGVNILRRFLSYASGLAGGIVCFKVAESMGLF